MLGNQRKREWFCLGAHLEQPGFLIHFMDQLCQVFVVKFASMNEAGIVDVLGLEDLPFGASILFG